MKIKDYLLLRNSFVNYLIQKNKGSSGHIHKFEEKIEAHNESGQCVVTTWQVCTDPNCPDGLGTHLNETTVTQAHQYTPISEIERVPGRWVITDKCSVCNHTRTRHTDHSELGTQSTPLSTMSNFKRKELITWKI